MQAGLIPQLTKRFDIWGPTRVNTEAPPSVANRFVWSAIAGLSKSESHDDVTLAQYADSRPRTRNPLIIIDQFEEILRLDPGDAPAKEVFFTQLGELLTKTSIWTLLILREDYLAPLDPYSKLVPTHLNNRFRLDRLKRETAAEAILKPLDNTGRSFAPGVADALVNDLATASSQYIEPLQLQVVCFDLWDRMERAAKSVIEKSDLGDVSSALRNYYDNAVARDTLPAERAIREWFETELIAPDGIRNQVRQQATHTGTLPNDVVSKLEDAYLVRAEPRGNTKWYELSHDRLVDPVRKSNAAWFESRLDKIEKLARTWTQQDEPASLLLTGPDLSAANTWAATRATLPPDVAKFLDASRAAQAVLDEKAKQAQRLRTALIAAIAFGVFGLLAACGALYQWKQAVNNAEEAHNQRRTANAQTKIAIEKTDLAIARGLAAAALLNQSTPDLAALLAVEASVFNYGSEAWNALVSVRHANPYLVAVLRAPGSVNTVAISADGKTIAGGGSDLTLRLWDVATRKIVREFKGHRSEPLSIAFRPDGRMLASGSLGGEILLWDLSSGTSATLPHAAQPVRRVAFSPDGSSLATVADDGATLWNVAQRTRIGADLAGGGVDGAFFPNGRSFVLLSGGPSIIDLATRKVIASAQTETGESSEVRLAVSPKATHVAHTLGKVVAVRDLQAGPAFAPADGVNPFDSTTRHNQLVLGLSFHPGGARLASSSHDSTIKEWDLDHPEAPPVLLQGHASAVNSLVYTPKGDLLISGGNDGAIMLWNRTTPLGLETYIRSAGPVQFTSDNSPKTSGRWPPLPAPCGEVCDPKLVIAQSPDGKVTAALDPNDSSKVLLRRASGAPLTINAGVDVTALALSPDASILAVGGLDKQIRFWDTTRGQPALQPLTGYQSSIRSLAYSPDGRLLASSDGDSRSSDINLDLDTEEHAVFIWDLETHLLFGPPLRGFRDYYIQLRFSPDSRKLALWSQDGVNVLDLAPAKLAESLCRLANRNLTPAEWQRYVGAGTPGRTCRNLPQQQPTPVKAK